MSAATPFAQIWPYRRPAVHIRKPTIKRCCPLFVRQALALLCILLVTACRLPLDPEGTSDEVQGATLKVGALMSPLDAVEMQAIHTIAGTFEATPQITGGDPHTLFSMLENGALHVVLGRLPKDTPFAPKIALTDPIGQLRLEGEDHDRVLALRKGENHFLVEVNRALKGDGK